MIKFDKPEFFYDPFPHALFKDVFDHEFYNLLCSEFPKEQKFERFDFDKQHNLKQKKYVLNDDNVLFKDVINKKKNLKKLYDYLNDEAFVEIILGILEKNSIKLKKNYRNSLIQKILRKIKRKKNYGFEFSMISTDGGFIKPHTDGADKLISFVIPVVDNDNFNNIINSGTNILKATDNKFKYNFLNSTVPFESTEIIRKVPFDKNQIFLFVKTHNSLHSVGPMKNYNGKTYMRKSINFFIYR